MSLFTIADFRSHSGLDLSWKIDADALTDADLATLAAKVAERVQFSRVIGVPRGGLRFALALGQHDRATGPLLIVDDVLTTGRSMEQMRESAIGDGRRDVRGVVIFARAPCPSWVFPIFNLSSWMPA